MRRWGCEGHGVSPTPKLRFGGLLTADVPCIERPLFPYKHNQAADSTVRRKAAGAVVKGSVSARYGPQFTPIDPGPRCPRGLLRTGPHADGISAPGGGWGVIYSLSLAHGMRASSPIPRRERK